MGVAPYIAPIPSDANIAVNVDLWPIVLVTVTDKLLLSDVEHLHKACDQVFAAEDRHAFIVDCTSVRSPPGPDVRKKLKTFEDSRQRISAEKGIACAIVFNSAIVRGAYTALRWISAQPVPNRAFGTVGEAAQWCIESIESEGVELPPEAHLLAARRAEVG